MILGIPVYEGVNTLDVMGPYEMFNWVPDNAWQVKLLSADGGPVTSGNGVTFHVHGNFADFPRLDILWVPGGLANVLGDMMSHPDSPYFQYLRQVAQTATWVCSVCEGAILAARAGVLDGHTVTTHWAFVNCLKRFPNITPAEGHPRFVRSGNRLTGGGISSGLDEALELISLVFDAEVAGQVQLTTQYFPDPPVSAKIPEKVPACSIHWLSS